MAKLFETRPVPDDLKAQRMAISPYYGKPTALEVLPVLLQCLIDPEFEPKFLSSRDFGITPKTLYTKFTYGWRWIYERGPNDPDLVSLDVDFDRIRDLRSKCEVSTIMSGVIIQRKNPKTPSVPEPDQGMTEVAPPADPMAIVCDWLEQDSPRRPLNLEGLSISDKDIVSITKIFSGMNMFDFEVTYSTVKASEKPVEPEATTPTENFPSE